jgi:hypothetical protein
MKPADLLRSAGFYCVVMSARALQADAPAARPLLLLD